MKTRYDTYHRSIASLGRQSADLTETQDRARPVRTDPYAPSGQPSVLEAFHPDITQAVTLLWGHPEMNQYFEKLWLDDGSGTPIAPEAMSELMLLAGVHRWLSPQRPVRSMAAIYDASHAPSRRTDLWDDVPRRR
jgi:hypothetical protein